MNHLISGGQVSCGIAFEANDVITVSAEVTNDAMIYSSVARSELQYIYLDFDGEVTNYHGEFLTIDNVTVEDSGLTNPQIMEIVERLNDQYAEQNLQFVTERPADVEFSTVFVGPTSDFKAYGRFSGLAETIDAGNLIKNDNAFVLLNAAMDSEQIAATIAHEVDHLVFGLEHGGEGLSQYARLVVIEEGEGNLCNNSRSNLTNGNAVTVDIRSGNRTLFSMEVSPRKDDTGKYYIAEKQVSIHVTKLNPYLSSMTVYGTSVSVMVYGTLWHVSVKDEIFDLDKPTGWDDKNSPNYKYTTACGIYVFANMAKMMGKEIDVDALVDFYFGEGGLHNPEDGQAFEEILEHGGLIRNKDFITKTSTPTPDEIKELLDSGALIALRLKHDSGGINHVITIDSISIDQHGNAILRYTDSDDNAVRCKRELTMDKKGGVSGYHKDGYTGIGAVIVNQGAWKSFDERNILSRRTVSNTQSSGSEKIGNVSVSNSGNLILQNNVTVSGYNDIMGRMQVNGPVAVEDNTQIDLSIAYNQPGELAKTDQIRHLAAAELSITLSNSQRAGDYVIASDASGFDGGIALRGTYLSGASGVGSEQGRFFTIFTSLELGDLRIGDTIQNGFGIYSLRLSEAGELVLAVSYVPDTEAPSIPAELSSQVVDNNVVLSWADSSDDVFVAGYELRYGTAENLADAVPVAVTDRTQSLLNLAVGSYYWQIRALDSSGNYSAWSEVSRFSVDYTPPDVVSPTITQISADRTEATNHPVTVSALFTDDVGVVVQQYKIGDSGWLDYTGAITVSANATVYFRAEDAVGNVAEAEYAVDNIDMELPTISEIALSTAEPTEGPVTVSAEFSDNVALAAQQYKLGNGEWQDYTGAFIVRENTTVYFRAVDTAGNEAAGEQLIANIVKGGETPDDLRGGATGFSWRPVSGESWYEVELSLDHFVSAIRLRVEVAQLSTWNLAGGVYQWRVAASFHGLWAKGSPVTVPGRLALPQEVVAQADGAPDLFMAGLLGTWSGAYSTRHAVTGELVKLDGKNRIGDVFTGSADANVLLLTDDANGDALCLDDWFTALPKGLTPQARFGAIDEIRAGAGDDLIDLSSDRFAHEGLIVRGGDGNDVIWANSGENTLFGDAGDDRIVGGGGDDVIVGGAGNDSMLGGGGEDIFSFGGNWGDDVIEQTAAGTVTLWFGDLTAAELAIETVGSDTRITSVRGSVLVKDRAITLDDCRLGAAGFEAEFKRLAALGAFAEESSRKIFEEAANSGALASL